MCIRREEERRRESGVLGCEVVLSRLVCSTPGSCQLVCMLWLGLLLPCPLLIDKSHTRLTPTGTQVLSICNPSLEASSTCHQLCPSFLCCTPSHFPESLLFLPLASPTPALGRVLSPLSLQSSNTSPRITFPSHLHPHPAPP